MEKEDVAGETKSILSSGNPLDWDCRHEWRVVEGFYSESSRTRRTYCAYCIYCLKSKAVEITNEEEKEHEKN